MQRLLTMMMISAAALAGGACADHADDVGDEATVGEPAAQLWPGQQRQPSAYVFGCKGTRVALETYNGRNYLSAVLGGGWSTMANATSIGKFETFRAYNLGDDRVALQAANGNYVVADSGGILLNANAPSIGTNSIFKLTWSSGGEWLRLRSAQGKYVTAEGGGGGVANAAWLIVGNNQGFKAICLDGDLTDPDSSDSDGSDSDGPDAWGDDDSGWGAAPSGPTRGGGSNDDVSSGRPGLGG